MAGTAPNAPESVGVYGRHFVGGGVAPTGAGVAGDGTFAPGVYGSSWVGPGVHGKVAGGGDGVRGESVSGAGVRGLATGTNGTSYGGVFQHSSVAGAGLQSWSSKSYAGHFVNTNAANSNATLRIDTSGDGDAVHAVVKGVGPAAAGAFIIDDVNNDAWALKAVHVGIGSAAYFQATNNLRNSHTVKIESAGLGNGLDSAATGPGDAVNAHTTGNGSALEARSFGSGKAVWARASGTGIALQADSATSASAIRAANDGGGAALEIQSGAIKVAGATVLSHTAAFIHRVTPNNTNFDDTPNFGEHYTRIDNPLCDGRPDALLFITPTIPYETPVFEPLAVSYHSGHWYIVNNSLDEFGDFDDGDQLNVLIILP